MLRPGYTYGRRRGIISFHGSMASAIAVHDLLTGKVGVTLAA